MQKTVSVCVANYKQDHFLPELQASIDMQTYKGIETVIYHDYDGCGSGEAFNRAIASAKSDIIVLMCADDYFTDPHVIEDIVKEFESDYVVHVSRYYHQFVDGDRSPVRAWRSDNVIELANNPSGLAFRADCLRGLKLTNKMFVEAPTLVHKILIGNRKHSLLKYDTVAVRIHKSTARSKDYYKKMWTSSPVEEWAKLGWKTSDFTHLIQVKNYFTTFAVLKEIFNFVKYNPLNILKPSLWFFGLIALLTPRTILLKIPEWYRSTVGKWTTKAVKREV